MAKISYLLVICVVFSCAASPTPSSVKTNESMMDITQDVLEYTINYVEPAISTYQTDDKLPLLLKISEILTDPEIGVDVNKVKPGTYIIYDKLEQITLGPLATFRLSSQKKTNIKAWHSKYMQTNPADVFFAPSAGEVIKYRAAFGCSHYARSFIAVVKALGIITDPENMRYAISCESNNYNHALEDRNSKSTINGHQFVMIKLGTKWIALNTSKSEFTEMPDGFSPHLVDPPKNIPVRFASYPDVTFLLRKIGRDYNDDCDDNSLTSLMNIYRSGNTRSHEFKWEKFIDPTNPGNTKQAANAG